MESSTTSNTNSNTAPSSTTTATEFDLSSYLTFKNLIIFIIFSVVLFFALNKSSDSDVNGGESTPSTFSSGGNVFLIVLAAFVFLAAYKLYKSYEVTTEINNEDTKNPELDININHIIGDGSSTSSGGHFPQRVPKVTEEVFNIPGNYYTYESARAVCKAYDADLATYNQVERAYNDGADWCNYGWSEGQMALFPTQQASYDKLQKIEGHEHDCGRPGVNGGYIANPNVRFGVNCYGKKPAITQYESDLMKTQPPYPETMKDVIFQKQVNYWKKKINDLLISPFNYTSWSKV